MFQIRRIEIVLKGFVIMIKKHSLQIFLSFYLFTSFGIFAQSNSEKVKESFQNQQRALSLSFYKNDIKSLEDAPMRCFLRWQIVRFVFSKKVKNHYDTATSFALDCLEDVEANPKQFTSSSANYWKSKFISLLRINMPETAETIEKKYFVDNLDSNLADFMEANSAKDFNAVVNRVLSKIQKGEVSSDLIFLISKLREKNPEASVTLLDAVLKHYETVLIINEFDNTLIFLSDDYLNNSIPAEIKKRFLNLTVKLGQKSLIESSNTNLFSLSENLLRWSLPEIKRILPALYPQASAIYTTLNSKISNTEREKREVNKRIERSEDKLQQTIAEAEAAENKNLKSELWMDAAKLALKEKKFRVAVDSTLKIEFDSKGFEIWKTQFLINDILSSALKEKDFEAAEYVVINVKDLTRRGEGIIKIAAKYIDIEDKMTASQKLNEALGVLKKAENSSDKARIMLSSVLIAVKIDKMEAFEIVNSAIKIINNLPTPKLEDKLETESRKEYVSVVLLPNSFNLVSAFEILSGEDISYAYPLSQGIQSKDWRLAVQIVVETKRQYQYTPTIKEKTGK